MCSIWKWLSDFKRKRRASGPVVPLAVVPGGESLGYCPAVAYAADTVSPLKAADLQPFIAEWAVDICSAAADIGLSCADKDDIRLGDYLLRVGFSRDLHIFLMRPAPQQPLRLYWGYQKKGAWNHPGPWEQQVPALLRQLEQDIKEARNTQWERAIAQVSGGTHVQQ